MAALRAKQPIITGQGSGLQRGCMCAHAPNLKLSLAKNGGMTRGEGTNELKVKGTKAGKCHNSILFTTRASVRILIFVCRNFVLSIKCILLP